MTGVKIIQEEPLNIADEIRVDTTDTSWRFKRGKFLRLDGDLFEHGEAGFRPCWLPLGSVHLCIDEFGHLRLRVRPAGWPDSLDAYVTSPVIAVDNRPLPTESSINRDPRDEF